MNNNKTLIIILFISVISIFFFPKLYKLMQDNTLPKIKASDTKVENKEKLNEDILEVLHFPKMRNSKYDINSYYSLDTFKISSMSNNDILYNAYLDMYEGNIISGNSKGKCTNISKKFNSDYMKLRIKNILGKNVDYNNSSFYVPEDSGSSYVGDWSFDGSYYIYDGLCSSKVSNLNYYDIEEFINAEYDSNDNIVVYFYVGFLKIQDGSYVIYNNSNMTKEIKSGTGSYEDAFNDYKSLDKNLKRKYKYVFSNTLCSYNEYCMLSGEFINE